VAGAPPPQAASATLAAPTAEANRKSLRLNFLDIGSVPPLNRKFEISLNEPNIHRNNIPRNDIPIEADGQKNATSYRI
jgi:hypothetical protein